MNFKYFPLCLLFISAIVLSCKSGTKQPVELSTKITSNTPVPEWSNDAVIYEVNVRQFTETGTFNAFAEHLPRLKELGVEILWFMPVYPIGETNRKGSLGSYYSIKNYTEINPEYGSIDDFKNIVNQAHKLGMKVILDWVANHTAWDHEWIKKNPEYYAKDSVGNIYSPYNWTDVAQLDYKNKQMRYAMTNAMEYWIKETNIDGYRCDMAGMVPVDFWEDLRASLNKIKPIYMLAEDEETIPLLYNAFNSNYSWSLHHIMNNIAKGEMSAANVRAYFDKADTLYPAGAYPINFTSNHDENSWNGSEYKRMGEAVKTFAALSFVIEGMPLIYTGQEAGLNKNLKFFDKDTVNWSNLSISSFYKSLIQLKKENRALWNGMYGGEMKIVDTNYPEQIFCFTRVKDNNSIIAIFNLSSKPASFSANTGITGQFSDFFSGRKISLPFKDTLLHPWEYMIFALNKQTL